MKKHLTFFLLLILPFVLQSQDKKVLFLGNSYTWFNDLPDMFNNLAHAAGYEVLTDKVTPGSCTLANPPNSHLHNTISVEKIKEQEWDYVILQEQSQYPVIPYWNENYFGPGAYALDSIITENDSCSKTMMFMTWGRKAGGMQCNGGYCSIEFEDFQHMTDSMASAYVAVAHELNIPVSPVGMAWKNALEADGSIDLFFADGSHPGPSGTYLAACTFFASIFFESPVGLEYYADLDEATATLLQEVAANTVFNDLELWNIDTAQLAAAFDYEQNNETIEFINQSIHANSYFWDFGDGETDTVENPVHTYAEAGIYQVDLVAINECDISISSAEIQIIIQSTGEQSNSTKTIGLYPNPGTGDFFIKNEGSPGYFEIDVFDIHGSIVYQHKKYLQPGISNKLDLNSLAPNLYLVHIFNNQHSFTERLLIR